MKCEIVGGFPSGCQHFFAAVKAAKKISFCIHFRCKWEISFNKNVTGDGRILMERRKESLEAINISILP